MNNSFSSSSSSNNVSLRQLFDAVRVNRWQHINQNFHTNVARFQNVVNVALLDYATGINLLEWIDGEARPQISNQQPVGTIVVAMQSMHADPWQARILNRAKLNDNICQITIQLYEDDFVGRVARGEDAEDDFRYALHAENENEDLLSFKSMETYNGASEYTSRTFRKKWRYQRDEIARMIRNSPPHRLIRSTDLLTGNLSGLISVRTWSESVALSAAITERAWVEVLPGVMVADWEGGLREERAGFVPRHAFSMLNLMVINKFWLRAFVGFGQPADDLHTELTNLDDHFHDSFSELIGAEFYDIHTERMSDHVDWHDDVVTIADCLLAYYQTHVDTD